jgi:urocanate hydratase
MAEPRVPSAMGYQPTRAPRDTVLSCHGWQQEGALRMLLNGLDPEVAEHPEEFIACSAAGRLARDKDGLQAIFASLRQTRDAETLLVRLGKVAGVFPTGVEASRAAISGASWAYVGTQGMLPTAYELFGAAAHKHFAGTLAGRLVISGGMGGIGGALPLAATARGAAFLGVDVDAERIKRRVKTGYCDLLVNDLDEALRILKNAVRKHEPASVGLIGNCANVVPQLARRGVVPDLLTDQTPADQISRDETAGGYIPQELTPEQVPQLRRQDPAGYRRRSLDSVAAHVRGMLALQKLGAVAFEYGNNIRAVAQSEGVADAKSIQDGAAEYLRPLYHAGRAPLLWVALSGDARDVARIDRLALEEFPADQGMRASLALSGRLARFQGLPARACWLERSGHAKFGIALNGLVARGEIKGPVAIASDALYYGMFSAPFRKQKQGHDISEAANDLRQYGALLSAANGASWISVRNDEGHHPQRTGWGVIADGTAAASQHIESILNQDNFWK